MKFLPDRHVRPWNSRELNGARETLVPLRVIVLKTDLGLVSICRSQRMRGDKLEVRQSPYGYISAFATEKSPVNGRSGGITYKKFLFFSSRE